MGINRITKPDRTLKHIKWIIVGFLTLLSVGCVRDDPGSKSATNQEESPTRSPSQVPSSTLSQTPTRSPSKVPSSTSSQAGEDQNLPEINMEDLDMREANVLGVKFNQTGAGEFIFEVTLVHDDLGEAPEYADWWIVEDLNGVELGRRVLLHSHGNQPFTRSEIIHIPDDVEMVLIRAHDMQHGYGGQAMQVDLQTGEVKIVSDPEGTTP